MKLRAKTLLSEPIRVAPGDHVHVVHRRGDRERIVADLCIREADSFNTAFIMELEPGDLGFARGFIGGIAQEDT